MMTPKIKSLAYLAGLNFANNLKGIGLVFGSYENSGSNHVTMEDLERFVDLIMIDFKNVEEKITQLIEDNKQKDQQILNLTNLMGIKK